MLSNISYKLSVLADFSAIPYNQETVLKLLSGLSGGDWMPTLNPMAGPNGAQNVGIQLLSQSESRIIAIMPNRFDIIWSSDRKEGFTEDEKKRAVEELSQLLKQLYEIFGNVIPDAVRMAWNSVYAYFEIDDETKLAFRQRFLKDSPFYSEHAVDEFAVSYVGRVDKKIAEQDETWNALVNINRWFPEPAMSYRVDGYRLEFDINTNQWNKKNRFSPDLFQPFTTSAYEIQKTLEEEIMHECH